MKHEHPKFNVSLEQKNPDFAAAPTTFQKEWMLQRALLEFSDDLSHLDRILPDFIPGVERPEIVDTWGSSEAASDDTELIIQGQQVMQAWERRLMKRLAEGAAQSHGDILEVGFGMGISASFILDQGVRSYTVIECNKDVISEFETWKKRYPDTEVHLVEGMWQDVTDQLGMYDGILFDTYPLSQEEYLKNEVQGTAYTHAGEFFPLAGEKLRGGGVFTYFTCEIDTLSRGHQRLLLEHFDSFSVSLVKDLQPPEGCQYWWADSMVAVEAKKAGS